MKKVIALMMVFAVVSMCSLSLNVFAGDKVEGDKEAVAYIGSVTIDGNIDTIWDSVPGIVCDTLKENASSYFGDSSKVYGVDYAKLTVKTLWNPDKGELYVLYIVEDKEISLVGGNDWEKDSIELFIDEDNARVGSYDDNTHQIRVLAEAGSAGDGTLYDAAVSFTTTGYIVEFVYYFQEAISSNTWVGFDVQVNDDAEGDGTRHACVGWSDPIDKASSDNTYWGQLYLSDILISDAADYNFAYVDQSDLNVVMAATVAIETEKETESSAPITAVTESTSTVTSAQTSDNIILFTALIVIAIASFIVVKRIKE